MVEVVTAEQRRTAQQRLREVDRARQTLQQERNKIQSQQALRTLSLQERQLRQKQLSQFGTELTAREQELKRISNLQTRQEVISSRRAQIGQAEAQARKLEGKGIPLAFLPAEVRKIALELKQGKKEALESNIIQLQEANLQPIIINQEIQGAKDLTGLQTLSRQALEQGFTRTTFTTIPTTPEPQQINKRNILTSTAGFLFQPIGIGVIPSIQDKRISVGLESGSAGTTATLLQPRVEEVKGLIQERGVLGLGTDLFKATERARIKSLTEPPSKEEAIALFTLPIFLAGTSAKLESEFIQDAVTGKFITKAEAKRLAQARLRELLRKGFTRVKTAQGDFVDLREVTRSAIQRNSNNFKNLNQLREIYKKEGRLELFDDILSQEGITLTRTSVDFPKVKTIEEAGIVTGKTAESEFAGLGLFERTEATATTIPTKQFNPLSINTNILTSTKDKQQGVFGLFSNLSQREQQLLATQQLARQRTKQKGRQRLRQRQQQLLLQQFRQQQQQLQRQRSRQGTPNNPFFTNPNIPRVRQPDEILLPDLEALGKGKTPKQKGKTKSFDIQFGKGKTARLLKAGLPLNRALLKGFRVTGETLRGSFKLIERGTTALQDIKKPKIPKTFRRSKKEKGRFIEKRRFRLDTPSEVRSILAKRRKGVRR